MNRPPDRKHAPVILVFGVPGVGKTSAIDRLVEEDPHCVRVSASDLLACSAPRQSQDTLRKLSGSEIIDNQQDIVDGIREVASTYFQRILLIDAHSVIDNDHTLVRVPVAVVEKIAPTAMVFLFDNPEHILQRRVGDDQRKRAIRSAGEIDAEQTLARDTCRAFAAHLGTRLYEYPIGDEGALRRLVIQYVEK